MSVDVSVPNGVSLTVTAEISDFRAFGSFLSHCNSDQQAEVLLGLAEGLHGLPGGIGGVMQIEYIREAVNDLLPENLDDVRWLLTELFARIVQALA